jgi:hypothetical protein
MFKVNGQSLKHLLAIDGIKPSADAQLNVNVELKAGYGLSDRCRPQEPVIVAACASRARRIGSPVPELL